MSERIAINVDNVSFTYPNGHEVFKGLNCKVQYGEKVAFIGPNGAGKSTFMSLLNGVELPTEGKITIDNLEVKKENLIEVRRKVGIVFQDPDDQLFCPTVFDDVAFGPLNLGLSKSEIENRVKEALAVVGLSGFEERASFHLSFGEKKRLALATVLSYQPELLIFDEPSTNMDPLNRRKLINWLKSSDKTILLCTHDLDIALDVCDRCLILADGKFAADGSASQILYNRTLLEENNLELPLVLITQEMLKGVLQTEDMDDEHRKIIGDFLHAHRHTHGLTSKEHIHIHAHKHSHVNKMSEGHAHGHHHGDHEHNDKKNVPHTHA